ncbi:MAG: Rieske (2Fe-2S) protein [Gammaproteobacteria bacterium]|nr:Rieske (2Fe-2S) protein [Gammaproteobacteria bacterium]
MNDVSASGTVVCRLEELQDPGSRGVTVQQGGHLYDVLVVRRGRQVFCYLNSCPHTGSPLDWMPDQFLSLDKHHIQCATHAALFRIEDGICIAGPCSGDALTPVPVVIDGDRVILSDHSIPAMDT